MSGATIAPYFPFRRIKILGQTTALQANQARIQVGPDKRFQPVCHHCGKKAAVVHSWTGRSVRDLDMAGTRVWLDCRYRQLYCAGCRRIVIEELDLFDPYLRITRRLAAYIHELCRWMTVRHVARLPGPGLEDGQGGRQALFRGPIRKTRPCGPSHPGGLRDLHPQGPSLPDRGAQLRNRPGCLCRQRSQSQDPDALF
jgi:hypothetical protein